MAIITHLRRTHHQGGGSPPDPNLVVAYAFEDGSGTTVTDATTNGNDGTINGTGVWTTSGQNGDALEFNGTDTEVEITNDSSLDVTDALTVMAWIYPLSIDNEWAVVAAKHDAVYYLAATSSGSSLPVFGAKAPWTDAFGSSALSVNTWVHIAGTFDGTNVRLFIDGVQDGIAARTADLSQETNNTYVGSSPYNEFFNGRIDDFRIYNRALSAAEIVTAMNTAVS